MANLDPFLAIWDEQYHALVAKNLLLNPLKPMLYSDPVFHYDYKNWTGNRIWLHKQPLFLWQIALSLKMFGINTLAVRLPSLVLHAISVLMVYRIGKIASNERIGFYGALFFAFAYYLLELVAGKFSTDHNDVAFLFYVTASIWAWFEYDSTKKKYFLVLIGVFSGFAVLVKWLVGLLIYALWFISIGVENKKCGFSIRYYKPMVASLGITIFTFLPWQIFILFYYPRQANFEFAYNTKHFFEPIENHGGDFWFHINALKDIYGSGDLVIWIYLLGLVVFLSNISELKHRVLIVSVILITYVFYSLAATKMTSFCILVTPFAFLGLGSLIENFLKISKGFIKNLKLFGVFQLSLVLVVCFFVLNLNKIQNGHTFRKPNENSNRQGDLDQMVFIKKVVSSLGDEKHLIFNANVRHNGHIPTMFFTNHLAFDFIPSKHQMEQLISENNKLAIHDTGNLPEYIVCESKILKLRN